MAIRRGRRFPGSRLTSAARRLLDASTLCAISTVSPGGRAHVNTAYFAWGASFEIVWLSAPEAGHSRNVRARRGAAIAVYDSHQTWGKPDRGIQLFGTAREMRGRATRHAETLYAKRFRAYAHEDESPFRFYELRPRRVKLFNERELGDGVFVTARVKSDGTLAWERTEDFA